MSGTADLNGLALIAHRPRGRRCGPLLIFPAGSVSSCPNLLSKNHFHILRVGDRGNGVRNNRSARGLPDAEAGGSPEVTAGTARDSDAGWVDRRAPRFRWPLGYLLGATRSSFSAFRISGSPRGHQLFAQQVCQAAHGRDSCRRDPNTGFVLDAGAQFECSQ